MKILVVANSLSTKGGIGNCLYRQLLYMNEKKFNNKITVLLTDRNINDDIKQNLEGIEFKFFEYEEEIFSSYTDIAISYLKKLHIFKLIKFTYFRALYKLNFLAGYYKYCASKVKLLDEEYDIAISYNVPIQWIPAYISKYIKAKYKILWAHIDIDQNKINKIKGHSTLKVKDIKKFSEIIKIYDKICCVSETVKESIVNIFPFTESKSTVIYNLMDYKRVKNLSIENVNFGSEYKGIKLLTVGRTSMEKGIDLAVQTAKKLRDNGYDFKWYFIGDNHLTKEIKEYINENDLENNVILLGAKENPYPYFRMCDIYVHPSRIEGYCTATNEARMLGKAVVTTDVAGAKEQFKNNENGFIVRTDYNEIYGAIKLLIDQPDIRKKFEINNSLLTFSNDESLHMIDEILKNASL